jgi:hypothetical protein
MGGRAGGGDARAGGGDARAGGGDASPLKLSEGTLSRWEPETEGPWPWRAALPPCPVWERRRR